MSRKVNRTKTAKHAFVTCVLILAAVGVLPPVQSWTVPVDVTITETIPVSTVVNGTTTDTVIQIQCLSVQTFQMNVTETRPTYVSITTVYVTTTAITTTLQTHIRKTETSQLATCRNYQQQFIKTETRNETLVLYLPAEKANATEQDSGAPQHGAEKYATLLATVLAVILIILVLSNRRRRISPSNIHAEDRRRVTQ
jgi:hypothetical protein